MIHPNPSSSQPAPRLAVYGAAFNPPHLGHRDAVAQLLDRFDNVLVVPAAAHGFGKQMAPFADRVAMARLLLADVAPDRVSVSDIEQRLLVAGKPVYTYDLLAAVREQIGVSPVFVVGPDNADPATWQRFYRADDIIREFGRVTVAERMPVRSTQIRALLAEGRADEAAGLVGATVADYIRVTGLYAQPVAPLNDAVGASGNATKISL